MLIGGIDRINVAIRGFIVSGPWQGEVAGISTDSRTVGPGEAFFALRGDRFDGNRFIDDALARGARCIISDRMEALLPHAGHQSASLIVVDDCIRALTDLASAMLKASNACRIALTGSKGKTTTTRMLAGILERVAPTIATRGNFNNVIGLPLSIFPITSEHRFAVFELGMNHHGEIERLTRIVDPDLGLLLNVGAVHAEHFRGLRDIARAKGELLDNLRPGARAVLNLDDSQIVWLSRTCLSEKIWFSGRRQRRAQVWIEGYAAEGLRQRFTLVTPDWRIEARLGHPGAYLVSNAVAATATAWAAGAGPEPVVEGLAAFAPLPNRGSITPCRTITLLDDTYNSNPDAARALIDVLAGAAVGAGVRAVAVLGDMLELGRSGPRYHCEVGRHAARAGVGALIGFGPLSEQTVRCFAEEAGPERVARHTADADRLPGLLDEVVRAGDWVLVKGSRGMAMERVTAHLKERF